jgi:hypothetical protein
MMCLRLHFAHAPGWHRRGESPRRFVMLNSLAIIIDRAKWLGHRVTEIVADASYASDVVYIQTTETACARGFRATYAAGSTRL